jgi:hypothetical protein
VSFISKQERTRLLVDLTCGLLSSGHYTNEDDGYDQPILKSYKVDWEDWKEAGFPRKHPFHVIDDAQSLLEDIEHLISKEVEA